MLISNSISSTSKLRVNCTKVHIIRLYFPAFPALPVLNIQLKYLFKNSIFYPHIIRNYTKRLNNIKNKNKSVTTNWRRPNHYKYNIWYGLGVKMPTQAGRTDPICIGTLVLVIYNLLKDIRDHFQSSTMNFIK